MASPSHMRHESSARVRSTVEWIWEGVHWLPERLPLMCLLLSMWPSRPCSTRCISQCVQVCNCWPGWLSPLSQATARSVYRFPLLTLTYVSVYTLSPQSLPTSTVSCPFDNDLFGCAPQQFPFGVCCRLAGVDIYFPLCFVCRLAGLGRFRKLERRGKRKGKCVSL